MRLRTAIYVSVYDFYFVLFFNMNANNNLLSWVFIFLWIPQVQWRALDEINAGSCDGMTYMEIKMNMPEEYEYVVHSFYIYGTLG